MRAVVDRIEDSRYAVLLTDDEREIVVPVEDLPIDVEGGTWISFDEVDGRLQNVDVDHEAQQAAQARVESKLEQLRARGRKPRNQEG